jgi:regulator of chromosome condensation
VDKTAPKYKLDASGNIVNGPPSAADEKPKSNGFAALFAGGAGASSAAGGFGGGATGGGFVFGGASAPAPAGGGFAFGSGGAPPATGGFVPAAGAGGFTFGSGAPAAASAPTGGFVFGGSQPPAVAPTAGGAEKRKAPDGSDRAVAKRLRSRELRLTGAESGVVLVVGNGDCGQLGLGDEDEDTRDSYQLVRMPTLDAQRIKEVVCGGLHTGALTLDGRIWTWGCNDDEVLGRQGNESMPAVVEGALVGKRVKKITAGDSHMAALTEDGQVYSWGTYKDSNGYIGYSPEAIRKPEGEGYPGELPWKAPTPTLVPNLPSIKALASGADHTLAISTDGYSFFGWGCGEKGQLGRELAWEKKTKFKYLLPTEPVSVSLPSVHAGAPVSAKDRHVRSLNASFLEHVRKIVETDGAADSEMREACETYLDEVSELSRKGGSLDVRLQLRDVFAGAYHSFVLTAHGNVYSFGLNNMGQLGLGMRGAKGDPEPNSTGTPTLVTALEGKEIERLAGGEHHSLALSATGQVYSFGRGDNNQLGLGDGTDQEVTPRLVPALEGIAVRKVATTANSNVALARSGDLYTWGFGEMGQLANGKGGDERVPALVEESKAGSAYTGLAALDAAAGGQHMVVVAMKVDD